MWKGALPAVRGLDLDQPFQSLRDRALHLGMAQCAIAFIPNGRLEFSSKAQHLLRLLPRRLMSHEK